MFFISTSREISLKTIDEVVKSITHHKEFDASKNMLLSETIDEIMAAGTICETAAEDIPIVPEISMEDTAVTAEIIESQAFFLHQKQN